MLQTYAIVYLSFDHFSCERWKFLRTKCIPSICPLPISWLFAHMCSLFLVSFIVCLLRTYNTSLSVLWVLLFRRTFDSAVFGISQQRNCFWTTLSRTVFPTDFQGWHNYSAISERAAMNSLVVVIIMSLLHTYIPNTPRTRYISVLLPFLRFAAPHSISANVQSGKQIRIYLTWSHVVYRIDQIEIHSAKWLGMFGNVLSTRTVVTLLMRWLSARTHAALWAPQI